MIAQHTADGFLPAGIHEASWAEFTGRFAFSPRRVAILRAVVVAFEHLAEAGCRAVYIGGSFVTTKRNPGDIDVVWEVTEDVDLDALHPVFLGPDGLPAIKALFAADLFPSVLREELSGRMFVEFFQHRRDGTPVGVVKLDLDTL